jgi:phage protein D
MPGKCIAPAPEYKILIGHQDKTGDFSPFLNSITFEDAANGETDILRIRLEDAEGRWAKSWYPVKGSQIEAWMGYVGALFKCGLFEIEEITLSGPPDEVEITAHGTPTSKGLRTKNSSAKDGKTLAEIADDIAAAHGLTIVGTVPDAKVGHVTQNNETDLGFLQRLADKFGAVFTVKGDKLIFHDLEALNAAQPVLLLKKSDIESWSFSDKIKESSIIYTHFDGDKQEVFESKAEAGQGADAIKSRAPAKSPGQQEKQAKAKAAVVKSKAMTARLSLEGNTKLMAGCNIDLSGFGVFDKVMKITKATHTIERGGGYRTELEVSGK